MQRALVSAMVVVMAVTALATANDADAQRRRRRARRAEPATLVIQSTLQGAEVLVDEEVVGVTPLEPIELTPGSHTIRVRKPGYTEYTDVIRARAGQRIELPVDLMALSMVLTVRTDPEEARVFVDGTFRGTTPLEMELIEGERSIRITHPTHREVIRRIVALPGETQALDLTLEPLPATELGQTNPEWFEDPFLWIGIGAGAAVVAIAIVVVAAVLGGQGGSPIDMFCPPESSNCLQIDLWQD